MTFVLDHRPLQRTTLKVTQTISFMRWIPLHFSRPTRWKKCHRVIIFSSSSSIWTSSSLLCHCFTHSDHFCPTDRCCHLVRRRWNATIISATGVGRRTGRTRMTTAITGVRFAEDLMPDSRLVGGNWTSVSFATYNS